MIENNNQTYALLMMVAIVAVVGIVSILSGIDRDMTPNITMPASVGEDVVVEDIVVQERNFVGVPTYGCPGNHLYKSCADACHMHSMEEPAFGECWCRCKAAYLDDNPAPTRITSDRQQTIR